MASSSMQYSYGWEKLYDTVRTLTLLDEASVRERLSVAWETYARLHGGERNLPEDLDERYHDIFDRSALRLQPSFLLLGR